jgi:beta-galactosidase
VRVSHRALREKDSYDMAAVRIRVLDELGNLAPYAQLPLTLSVEGAAELVGPAAVTAEGGMCGCYVKTKGISGAARLTICGERLESRTIDFAVEA